MIGDVALEDFKIEGGRVSFVLKGPAVAMQFSGTSPSTTGLALASPIHGTLKFMNDVFPASLKLTEEEKVAEPKANPVLQEIGKAMRQADPKDKMDILKELIARNGGAPSSQVLYPLLLSSAPEVKLPASEVEKAVETWLKDASSYGSDWVDAVRIKALRALAPSKEYADTALTLGQDADKSVSADAPLETQAAVVGLLATAANNAGKTDVAKDAEARAIEARNRT